MIVIGDEEKRKACADWYSKMEINKNFTFNIVAMTAAYTSGERWLSQVTNYLKGNIELLRNRLLENMPAVKLVEPEEGTPHSPSKRAD